jgi:4-amino-4-deoxy-L-arabinose transferase-like glycosyltransferase
LWLCFTWVVVITLFFSLSHSKLPGYIFPVIPALAILAGKSLLQLFENKNRLSSLGSNIWQIQLIIFGVLFFIGFFFLPNIAKTGESYEASSYASYANIIGISLLIGVLGCFCAWCLRQDTIKSFLIFSSTMILVALTAGTGHESVGRLLSGYDLAMQAKPLIRQNSPLYGIKMLDHTIPFYLEHPMIMVEFKDELAFGIGQEPERWIPTEAEWIKLWLTHPEMPAYALMSPNTYEQLLKQHLPMEVIAQDPLRIIVGKPIKK